MTTATKYYFRGGSSVVARADEYKLKDGKVQPTHGVSVYSNAERVRKWGAYQIVSVPATLRIIQRGKDPEHFEIVPTEALSAAAFQAALAEVVLERYDASGGEP